jgi:hypothetical protein
VRAGDDPFVVGVADDAQPVYGRKGFERGHAKFLDGGV